MSKRKGEHCHVFSGGCQWGCGFSFLFLFMFICCAVCTGDCAHVCAWIIKHAWHFTWFLNSGPQICITSTFNTKQCSIHTHTQPLHFGVLGVYSLLIAMAHTGESGGYVQIFSPLFPRSSQRLAHLAGPCLGIFHGRKRHPSLDIIQGLKRWLKWHKHEDLSSNP